MKNAIDGLILASLLACAMTFLYFLLYLLPLYLVSDSECARQGYPFAKVTVDAKAYCMNLDGSIVVKVKKL